MLAVGVAAVLFLHSVPLGGNDSVAHHITGSAAWVAALVMMALADVLTRLAVIWRRGRRLAAPAARAAIPAGAGA